jgi:hypothetical protein
MTLPLTSRAILMAATVSMAATSLPFTAAQAQGYDQPPPPPSQYQQQQYDQPPPPPPSQYQQQQYDQGGPPDQGPPPPPGYDGRDPPPPPPGYDQASAPPPDQQAADQRYARYAENWARYNCVQSHANVGAGVAVGSLFGALIGAGLGGRHAGGGAIVGAIAGGAAGGAIAASEGSQTSPGCPPGFVVRDGGSPFYYGGQYAYAAPYWYRPWIFDDGAWVFRPYPYHTWYYGHYYRGGGRGGRHWR